MPAVAFAAEPAMMRFRQTLLIGTGWAVFGLGVLVAPLPGPFGFPIMIVGGIILLRNSAGVRRRFARMKRRPPGLLKPVLARFDVMRMQARRKRRG